MILHLAQAATETPPAPISNPTYILIGAAIGGVAGVVAALITSWRADRREHESWRREQLGTAVASVLDKLVEIKKAIEASSMHRGQLSELLRSTTDDVYRIQLVSSDWFAGIVLSIIDEMADILVMNTALKPKRLKRINDLQSALILTARKELKKSRTSYRYRVKANLRERAWKKANRIVPPNIHQTVSLTPPTNNVVERTKRDPIRQGE